MSFSLDDIARSLGGNGDAPSSVSSPPPAKKKRRKRPNLLSSLGDNGGGSRDETASTAVAPVPSSVVQDGEEGERLAKEKEIEERERLAKEKETEKEITQSIRKAMEKDFERRQSLAKRRKTTADKEEEEEEAELSPPQEPDEDAALDEKDGEEKDEPQELQVDDDGCADEIIDVIDPYYGELDARLGRKKRVDRWCYLCNVVYPMSPEMRPKEAMNLMAKLAEYNMELRDKVDVAIYTKAIYDKTIREPASRKGGAAAIGGDDDVVKEWTLRSIYIHITQKSNGSTYILDEELNLVNRILHDLELGLWQAPRCRVNKKTNTAEPMYRLVRKKYMMYIDKMLGKTVSLVNAREKLRLLEGGGGGGGGGGGRGRRGGRKSGTAESVSALADVAASRSSTAQAPSERALQINANRPV